MTSSVVQDEKNKPWRIKKYNEITKNEKYILGCTPLLIFNCKTLSNSTLTKPNLQ